MLADFQEAFAELVSWPELCTAVRREPEILRVRHALNDREWRRLVAIANHKGMAAACMIYRANRIVPLLMHLPLSCKALKGHLREAVSRYWLAHPDFHANGFFEADRFARFLSAEIERGVALPDGVSSALAEESPRVADELKAGLQMLKS